MWGSIRGRVGGGCMGGLIVWVGALPAGPEVSVRFLCLDERVVIADLWLAEWSMRGIARELARNVNPRDGYYGPYSADVRARERRLRPRVKKIEACPRQREVVQGMLDEKLSPSRSRRLRRDHPEDPEYRVSH